MSSLHSLALPTPAGEAVPELGAGTLQFIGTATVLLRYAGFTILTDPNFLHQGDQVHLGYGLRSTRLTEPALALDALPPIDLVMLSHLHEDHFDQLVDRRLNPAMPIVTTPHAAEELAARGFHETRGLATWESLAVNKGDAQLRITALPARHAPGPLAALLPPVMGSMLDFSYAGSAVLLRLYSTGDTLLFDQLREIPRRYPEIDIMVLHLGGARVLGLLVTMDAKQGTRALEMFEPKMAIPVHYNDYTIFTSPLEDFAKRVAMTGRQAQVRYLRHGDTYAFDVNEQGLVC